MIQKTQKYAKYFEIDFDPRKNGDTEDNVDFDLEVSGAVKDLTGAEITFISRYTANSDTFIEEIKSTGINPGIIISSTVTGRFTLSARTLVYPNQTKSYPYEILIKFPGSIFKRYIFGVVSIIENLNR